MASSYFIQYPVTGDVAEDIQTAVTAANAAADRAEDAADRAEAAPAFTSGSLETIIAARDAALAAQTGSQSAQTASEAAKALSETAATNAATSATSASTSAQAAADSASSASQAADSASANAATTTSQALVATNAVAQIPALTRTLAGVAIDDLAGAAAGDFSLNQSNKFGAIYRTRADIDNIILPLNWHTDVAANGKPSVAFCRVYNRHASEDLVIKVPPAASNQVIMTTVAQGTYKSALADAADENAKTITFSFDAPAGVGRKAAIQFIADLATRTSPTTNIRVFDVSGITGGATNITKSLSDTGPGGHKDLAPRQSAVGWTFDLPDSAHATTSHTISFAFPADVWSAAWRVAVGNNVTSVTITGASITTGTLSPSVSPTGVANGVVCVHFGMVGGDGGPTSSQTVPTDTIVKPIINSGTAAGGADVTSWCAHVFTPTATTYPFGITWTAAAGREGSQSVAIFSPTAGSAAVTIDGVPGGSVTVPAGSDAEIEAYSWGNQYRVRVL